jgi:hypothetical protein
VQAICRQVAKAGILYLDPLWPQCPSATPSLPTHSNAYLHTLGHFKEATARLQGRVAIATGACWPPSLPIWTPAGGS